jgi:hypothetical protein
MEGLEQLEYFLRIFPHKEFKPKNPQEVLRLFQVFQLYSVDLLGKPIPRRQTPLLTRL